jgi:hypothetical protein
MKKVFAMLMVAGLAMAFVACGGAAKEAAAAKAKADSIAVADSIAKAVEAAAAAIDTVKADSAK